MVSLDLPTMPLHFFIQRLTNIPIGFSKAKTWANSAYICNSRTIPVNRKPASLTRCNTIFDAMVAHICVRSEHCMGALKGQWQCLHRLCISISNNREHVVACRWITIAIILHNAHIDPDGEHISVIRGGRAGAGEEHENHIGEDGSEEDETKRKKLIDELIAYSLL